MINKAVRPFITDVEKVRNELAQAFNIIIQNNNVPCYFLAPIFADMLSQIEAVAKTELEEAQRFVQTQAQAQAAAPAQAQQQSQVQPQPQAPAQMPSYEMMPAEQPVISNGATRLI